MLCVIRRQAKMKFANRLHAALKSYAADSSGALPDDVSQLRTYLDGQKKDVYPDSMRRVSADGRVVTPHMTRTNYPPTDETLFKRYKMIAVGPTNSLHLNQYVVGEKSPVDDLYDSLMKVGMDNCITIGTGKEGSFGHSGTPDMNEITPEQLSLYNQSQSGSALASQSAISKINSRIDAEIQQLNQERSAEIRATMLPSNAIIQPYVSSHTNSTVRLNQSGEGETDDPALNICIKNLRMIDAAKAQFAFEHNATSGSELTESQIAPYLAGGKLPICPAGGAYTIGRIGDLPTCSHAGHALP
jgi:hypothetical protein